MSWTPRAFTGIDSMSKNVNIPPLSDYYNVVFNTMLCGFCHKKQGVLSKSPCFIIFIQEDIVFNTICKWFTNMDIIYKAALVRGI